MAFIVDTDITERISKMSIVLKRLSSGAYLLGTGPSTVGIIPLIALWRAWSFSFFDWLDDPQEFGTHLAVFRGNFEKYM